MEAGNLEEGPRRNAWPGAQGADSARHTHAQDERGS